MPERCEKILNYLGLCIGFVGALLMAIAITTSEGGQIDGPISVPANERVIHISQMDISRFVLMKYPFLNSIGIVLLVVGFFIQLFPAVLWIVDKLSRGHK